MFKPKNKVIAKNPNLPFWMTVEKVNERLQLAHCYFGYSGKFAGVFLFSEIKMYEGA